jgi:hypothetical protein
VGVDFLMRYERLTDDYAEVCSRIGVTAEPLPKLKSGHRSKRMRYTDYYDDDLERAVGAKHATLVGLFGYEFGG